MLSEKILVIDDDPRVIKSIKMALSEYEIIDYTDGRKAVEFLKKSRGINFVLLDVMMPKIDGLAVLHEIRKHNKDIIVMMMTAYATKDIAVQALRDHADDFIEKPFDMEDLRKRTRNFLRSKEYLNIDALGKDYKVNRIKSFVARNYQNSSLDLIADELCLSPKYISRMFKEQSGESYRNYHIKVKIDIAKSLLETTSLTIDEISYKLGYHNPESFMRIFKRKIGCTPTQFRERQVV